VSQFRLEVLANRVTVDPCLFVGRKVPQVNQQKPVSHEKTHGQETDCDVVFTIHILMNFEFLTQNYDCL
jgi:hypothetical protein